MPVVPGAPDNLLLLVGPMLLGSLFSWFLYGILVLQLYIYHLSFPGDRPVIKLSVYGLFLVDTFQTVAVTSTAWSFLCSGWGRLENLRFTDWGFALIPLISGINAAWVQLFFAWRIYILGKGRNNVIWAIIVTVIVLISLAQACAGIAAGIRFLTLGDVTKFPIIYPTACTWLGGSVASDVIIAVSMVILLVRAKNRSDVNPNTNRILTRLIRLTVETGVVTATAAVLDLGFFLGSSDNNLYLLLALCLSKLYTNTFYASLNSRSAIIRAGDIPASFPSGINSFFSTASGSRNPAPPIVHVSKITEVSDPNSHPDSKVSQSGPELFLESNQSAIPMVDFPHYKHSDIENRRKSASFD